MFWDIAERFYWKTTVVNLASAIAVHFHFSRSVKLSKCSHSQSTMNIFKWAVKMWSHGQVMQFGMAAIRFCAILNYFHWTASIAILEEKDLVTQICWMPGSYWPSARCVSTRGQSYTRWVDVAWREIPAAPLNGCGPCSSDRRWVFPRVCNGKLASQLEVYFFSL